MIAGKAGQAGIALVLALWLLLLISIMAAGYGYAMRTETMLTIHGVEAAKARGVAEAGLWLALADLLKPQSARRWRTDGSRYQVNFGGNNINLSIQDEAGKIDLNAADEALLRGLLETAAAPGADVTFLLHAILDWRDPDRLRRNPGAEDSDYETAGYGAKDGPFNSVEELRWVAGMTDDVYGMIRPAVTIHHPLQPGINPDVAPREALAAIPGADAELIMAYLTTRQHADGTDGAPVMNSGYFNAAQGPVFTVASEGMAGRGRLKLEMVV
ncbi:MAG: type II secretion system protein GspK, partial [Gammaproteobacteria bacterium]|nr:type II secretion system protein GspK [Gammaproteobacteria bacterium]